MAGYDVGLNIARNAMTNRSVWCFCPIHEPTDVPTRRLPRARKSCWHRKYH